jgi:hypothetical protein
MMTNARKNPMPESMANTGSTWALDPCVRRGSVCGARGRWLPMAAMVFEVVEVVVVDGRGVVRRGATSVVPEVGTVVRDVFGAVVDGVDFGTVGAVVDGTGGTVVVAQPRMPQWVVRVVCPAAHPARLGPTRAVASTTAVAAPRATSTSLAIPTRRATNTSVAHGPVSRVAGAVEAARRREI